ncbi:SRPBCC family protein [Leifsonia sp. fls2-241-R2A-40a]|uniref:SRPBCC family protein n=1 Tax=Leifsonia sp. fls2-241-R2A-40a TaxID=3040290 RepID=UPI00254EED98|nr:SRPBCC family protein [Leifsonia sp. fls2-241-R2A-40a]
MWTTEHTARTVAPAAAVWASLRDLHSGIPLGPASDRFELHGPFAVGTEVTVTPQGQEPMTSTIVELEPERVYADRTLYGELALTFRHTLAPDAAGGTVVTHTLEVDGPGSDQVGPELGPQIAADFPVAMNELLRAAEARAAGDA